MDKLAVMERAMNSSYVIDNSGVPLAESVLLDEDKNLRILSYEDLKHIPQEAISAFCVKYGIYNVPTLELIEFIQREIGKSHSKTIEIGAGNGIMAKALGIIATDSFMQDRPEIKEMYENALQTTVSYGTNVMPVDGIEAVKTLKPNIVVAAWVTHKYNPKEHHRGGNMYGVDEEKILKKVKKYIFIGNENSHSLKPIMKYDHSTFKAEWLISRSLYKDKNFIKIWKCIK